MKYLGVFASFPTYHRRLHTVILQLKAPGAALGLCWPELVWAHFPVSRGCGLLRVAVAQPWGLEELCGHLPGCGWDSVGWKRGMIRKFVKTTFVWLRLSRKRCSPHWFLLRLLDMASWDGLGW